VPTPSIIHIETPSPFTPLGAKGLGEGNCMSTPVAIANAACDALKIDNVTLPLTHSKVHSYITSNLKEQPRSKLNSNKNFIKPNDKNNIITGQGNNLLYKKPNQIWDFLLNPDNLSKILPVTEKILLIKENHYEGKIKIKFGPITGEYEFSVLLSKLNKPKNLKLSGKASGPLGTASGEGLITLSPMNKEKTELTYQYDVQVSGKIAAIGGRFLKTASNIIINQFFDRLAQEISPEHRKNNFWNLILKCLKVIK
jgi:2-furoyl-CoA dehydrogenase large subunit